MTPDVAASFASIAWGWIVAFLVWALRQVYGPGPGELNDFAFMLTWPATFSVVAWLVVVLPALRQPWLAARLQSPSTAWFAWPLLGLLAYGLLVATWLRGARALIAFPLAVSVTAGLVFPALRRSTRPGLVAVTPLVVVLAFAFVGWPLLEHATPYTTYVWGNDDSRSRSLERVLSRVHAGDAYADLHLRYPRIFDAPALHMLGNSGAGARGFTYRVEFDETGGRVTRVDVQRRGAP